MPDDNKKTVGYKKMEYLNRFYNNDRSMKVNIKDLDNSTLKKTMDTIKKMRVCPHNNSNHKARFMCNYCYLFRSGNNQKAWRCEHVHAAHHSKGYCKSCYQRMKNAEMRKNSRKARREAAV